MPDAPDVEYGIEEGWVKAYQDAVELSLEAVGHANLNSLDNGIDTLYRVFGHVNFTGEGSEDFLEFDFTALLAPLGSNATRNHDGDVVGHASGVLGDLPFYLYHVVAVGDFSKRVGFIDSDGNKITLPVAIGDYINFQISFVGCAIQ